jgi:hypothetical protein
VDDDDDVYNAPDVSLEYERERNQKRIDANDDDTVILLLPSILPHVPPPRLSCWMRIP